MPHGPNILSFHIDNLGFGELSCYSGGPFRGVWTRRIDAFAGQGPADQLRARSAVHADPLGAADRAARDPVGEPQCAAEHTITIDLGGDDVRTIRRTTTQAVRSIKGHRPRSARAAHVS